MAQQEKKSWQKAQANSLFWNWLAEIPDMQLRLTGMVTYREKWWREDSSSPIYVQCKNTVNQSFAVKNIGLSCQSEGWGLKTLRVGHCLFSILDNSRKNHTAKPFQALLFRGYIIAIIMPICQASMAGRVLAQGPNPTLPWRVQVLHNSRSHCKSDFHVKGWNSVRVR